MASDYSAFVEFQAFGEVTYQNQIFRTLVFLSEHTIFLIAGFEP